MELEQGLPAGKHADDFNLAPGVAHGVAHRLAQAVLPGLGVVHNPDALGEGHLEAALDPGDRAALEDIVGHDPQPDQAGEELPQGLPVVVDAPHQNRLVPHGHAPPGHGPEGPGGLSRQLPGVVEVGHQDQGLFLPIFLKEVQELRVAINALRQGHGHPGAEADQVQVLDGGELPEVALQDVVGVHEGVPAGNQDVVDLLVFRHIGHGLVYPLVQLRVGEAHHPLAETVAAVHGALVGGQEQGRLGVLVLQTLDFGVVRLAAGVRFASGVQLRQGGDAHPADGALRVLGVHQGQVIGWDQHGIPLDHPGVAGGLLRRPSQDGRQVLRRPVSVPQFVLPAHSLPPPF